MALMHMQPTHVLSPMMNLLKTGEKAASVQAGRVLVQKCSSRARCLFPKYMGGYTGNK